MAVDSSGHINFTIGSSKRINKLCVLTFSCVEWLDKRQKKKDTETNWVSNQPKQIYTKRKKIYTHNRNAIYFSFFFFCFFNCKHKSVLWELHLNPVPQQNSLNSAAWQASSLWGSHHCFVIYLVRKRREWLDCGRDRMADRLLGQLPRIETDALVY